MQSHITHPIITSLAECSQRTEQEYPHDKNCHAIALSAESGAGGKEVATILAKRLDVPLYDREIMDAIAHETHLNKHLLERLDERVDGLKGAWLYSILAGENFSRDNYYRTLVHVLLDIAHCCCHHGGVILGRGGSFILADKPVFRVHIVGSLAPCTARVAAREGITLEEAKRKIKQKNKARRNYIKTLFKCDNNDPTHFDLVINSDHLPPSRIADLIFEAWNCVKFK
ncbi:MAG: Cytidylate kinase [Candidatus Kentron sp. G]|nr:MAG: Cytidylate kinase [Candidatus Kentron sp. G]VFN03076.1 MAG: Cytidylate kinase [Candidatus Kentron sp. G]VFN05045.1 MAG: Cytidylate kinase [Candidatus Kentron sp. G]